MALIRKTAGDKTFDFFNVVFFIIASVTFLYPFWHVLVVSFSTPGAAAMSGFKLYPKIFTLASYEKVLKARYVWVGYANTVFVVIVSWGVSMFFTISGAYPLSKKYLPNRSFWTLFVVFTMFFQGGMIPLYLLIRNLQLINSRWALILPAAISTWNLIIMRNFFMAIPNELEEAAYIDGASPLYTLIRVILPIAKPMLATISLWIIVARWNGWFDCLIYITDASKYVLQVVLRRVLAADSKEMLAAFDSVVEVDDSVYLTDTMTSKCATIMVATFPILCVYPFIQKYFVKGIMIGSLKG